MRQARFTENDYLERVIKRVMQYEHRRAVTFQDQYFESNIAGVLAPLGSGYGRRWDEIERFYSSTMYVAYRNAELMRWSLVDETVPYRPADFLTEECPFYDGGRYMNAYSLGELQYHFALPELSEAMTHDRDTDMKYYSAEAIGKMGNMGRKCCRAIREAIRNVDDCYFRRGAIEALMRLDDKESLLLLCDLYEETAERLDESSKKQDTIDSDNGRLLEMITRALFLFDDKKTAIGAIARGLRTNNRLVLKFTENALFWADEDREYCQA